MLAKSIASTIGGCLIKLRNVAIVPSVAAPEAGTGGAAAIAASGAEGAVAVAAAVAAPETKTGGVATIEASVAEGAAAVEAAVAEGAAAVAALGAEVAFLAMATQCTGLWPTHNGAEVKSDRKI